MQFKLFRAQPAIIAAAVLVAVIAGCGVSRIAERREAILPGVQAGFEGMPDNCTRCHYAWAAKFDYFHGWDRYGYIYGDMPVAGYYDPWYEDDVENMEREYYATDWWESPEDYPWPANIEQRVRPLSVLSRPGGLPAIPGHREDITGPVIEVRSGGNIQEAIDRAIPGTTVYLRAGTYNEPVVLKDGVSLVGENAVTTIINPLNTSHAVIAANHSLIANLTLTGTGIEYETGAFHAAIYATGVDSTCVIARNIFRENGLFGVWIEGTLDRQEENFLRSVNSVRDMEMAERPYTDYPNPVIVGNTFYRIGQRAVYCVHARGEIFNNVFSGNVKAVGMDFHSRPLFHHNVCYYSNVPMAINRSEPVVFNNIMLHNQWGQRMLRGANPVIFGNVTWNSPFFRDFDESGRPTPYNVHPGTGEMSVDPRFIDPLAGDFRFADGSPFVNRAVGFDAVGIMRDAGLPQPPAVQVTDSYGREVLAINDDVTRVIASVDSLNDRIDHLLASYTITYRSWLDVIPDSAGDPSSFRLSRDPVVEVTYDVPQWSMHGNSRIKEYHERRTVKGKTTEYSGRITYNGIYLTAEGRLFGDLYNKTPDPLYIGERPFRENPGGFYRDYDQYVKGAIGPLGTFYNGYLRIMGGAIDSTRVDVDGHSCIRVRYPHIGADQYYYFYLDPSIGYRPRKMEQYYGGKLYRSVDSYDYRIINGIALPVSLHITDLGVSGDLTGKTIGELTLSVNEGSIQLN